MKYTIRYSKKIDWKRLKKLPRTDLERLEKVISKKIAVEPELFGMPLRKSYKGCRSTRMGGWRIIYRVHKEYVEILTIDHRSVVYEK